MNSDGRYYNKTRSQYENNEEIWYGDMKALEDINNLSFCVKESTGIRKIHTSNDLINKQIVAVFNPMKIDETNPYFSINEGEMVRYKHSKDISFSNYTYR